MPHLFHALDFTVAVFVVHADRVLLVHHRKLGKWLPLGGHIDVGEDPEQAAHREVREESGLTVELLGAKPPTDGDGTRALVAPRFLDVHKITDSHEHVGMIYWARPTPDQDPKAITLATAEHHALRWVAGQELALLQPPMSAAVRWYCEAALREIPGCPARGGH